MAFPRKPNKSESSSNPSSGNNSKRNSLNSKNSSSGSSSGSNSKRNSLSNKNSSTSTSGREEIINLGFTEDIDEAESNTKNWIIKEMKESQGTWVARWGSKLTGGVESGEGIASLGSVIGKDYVVEKGSDNKEQKADNPSYYRVDWDPNDPKKGLHYNAVSLSKVKDRYIAYPFGNREKTLLLDSETNKTIGELSVINKMKALTTAALNENELMPAEIAQRILKNFENPTSHIKEHFKEFGSLLRELINKAYDVILQSGKANTDDAYKFNKSQLSERVSEYLAEIWKPAVTNQLEAILSESTPEDEKAHVKQVMLSEAIFAASNKPFSEKVLFEFSCFLTPIEKDQHVNNFIEYIKDLADENEPLLDEFQKRIFEHRRSASPDLQESRPEQIKKSTSSTASAMVAMMSSKTQATQVLKQASQTSRVAPEQRKSQASSSSVSKVSSSLANMTIENKADDKKEDSANTSQRMRH